MSDQPIIVAGPTSVTITTAASVVIEDREVAWVAAKEQIQTRPDMGWLVGRYLATDVSNENGHTFRLADIETAHQRIVHTPLNMLHRATHVVGTYVATELVRAEAMAATHINVGPDGSQYTAGSPLTTASAVAPAAASREGETAHVEALAAVWRYVFVDEWKAIREANEQGSLYYSMEAIPKSVTCPSCATTAAYAGPASDTYCEHMATAGGPKILDDPLFVGGAIVIPPAKPGWRHADITELASFSEEQVDEVFDQLTRNGLDTSTAESLMAVLLSGGLRGLDVATAARFAGHLRPNGRTEPPVG